MTAQTIHRQFTGVHPYATSRHDSGGAKESPPGQSYLTYTKPCFTVKRINCILHRQSSGSRRSARNRSSSAKAPERFFETSFSPTTTVFQCCCASFAPRSDARIVTYRITVHPPELRFVVILSLVAVVTSSNQ